MLAEQLLRMAITDTRIEILVGEGRIVIAKNGRAAVIDAAHLYRLGRDADLAFSQAILAVAGSGTCPANP